MTDQPHAVFRADASAAIGGGHVLRCLVLANELQSLGWRTTFVTNESATDMIASGMMAASRVVPLPTGDLACPASAINAIGGSCDLMVIDHYGLDAAFEKGVRQGAATVIVLDDLGTRRHDCDLLLDPSPGRKPSDYTSLVPANCRVLTGPHFALLRRDFISARARTPLPGQISVNRLRVVISFGLTDPVNMTAHALRAIAESGLDIDVDVILGGKAPHLDEITQIIGTMNANAVLHIDPTNMPWILTTADLAIGGAGGSALERCCLGLPSIVLSLADNQESNIRGLAEVNAILPLKPRAGDEQTLIAHALQDLVADRPRRIAMSIAAARICDGHGAGRVAQYLWPEMDTRGNMVTTRPADVEDTDRVFKWQTIPGIRKYSRTSHAPMLDEHRRWMQHRLLNTKGIFEILECGPSPCGFIRLDPIADAEDTFEVSILIDPEFQGRGIGTCALRLARRLVPDGIFHASIHKDNAPSIRIFMATGYCKEDGRFVSRVKH